VGVWKRNGKVPFTGRGGWGRGTYWTKRTTRNFGKGDEGRNERRKKKGIQ